MAAYVEQLSGSEKRSELIGGGKVKPGARYGLLGDNELAGKVLGQAFEPARCINGVADRGNRGSVAVAHLSDDSRPAMNADTNTQRPIELGPQRSVELGEPHRNQSGSGQRVPAADLGAALDPEQRHYAVADELVDASSRRFDRISDRGKIAVEGARSDRGWSGEDADLGNCLRATRTPTNRRDTQYPARLPVAAAWSSRGDAAVAAFRARGRRAAPGRFSAGQRARNCDPIR
jgi:hypothetical protein